jgi:diguanylate cyclase (GGDEF)-like protein
MKKRDTQISNIRAPFAAFAAFQNNQTAHRRRMEDDPRNQSLTVRNLRRQNARLLAERDTLKTRVHELRRACETDPLTGVYNRRGLEAAFEKMKRTIPTQGRAHLLVFLDGDQFGQVNKIYGDDVGDRVIAAIAASLQCHTRKTDVVARKGGDEFIILLRNVPIDQIEQVLRGPRGLQSRVNAHTSVPVGAAKLDIHCSMGGAFFGTDDMLDDVMRRADMAMRGNKMVRKAMRLLNAA